MAKIEFEKIMTFGEIKALLHKDLNSKISVEVKKNRIEVVQDSSKGCLILLGEKDGRTSVGLTGYMPSGGLRAALTFIPFGIWFFLLFFIAQSTSYLVIVLLGAALPIILITLMRAPSKDLVSRVELILRNGRSPIDLQENQSDKVKPKGLPKTTGRTCPKCGFTPRFNDRKCRKCGENLR
jgi:hypothetical protein